MREQCRLAGHGTPFVAACLEQSWAAEVGPASNWQHSVRMLRFSRSRSVVPFFIDLMRRSRPLELTIICAASSTEASEWNHSIWQQMLSATIPQKYSKTFFNKAAFENESWPDGRATYVPNGLRMVETRILEQPLAFVAELLGRVTRGSPAQ
jgi:hypothetical protein